MMCSLSKTFYIKIYKYIKTKLFLFLVVVVVILLLLIIFIENLLFILYLPPFHNSNNQLKDMFTDIFTYTLEKCGFHTEIASEFPY